MYPNDSDYAVDGKISAIKLVRAFTGLSLCTAKIIVEKWMKVFNYQNFNFQCNNSNRLCTLGKMARKVEAGEWVINEKGELVISKVVDYQDIANL